MARPERVNSATMTQNVGLKGLNDENVFLDDEDREVFLDAMAKASEKSGVEVSAWALMDNHVHLLMHGEIGDFSPFFQSLQKRYVSYFNKRYERTGTIWNGRYYAKPIESAEEFRQVAAYIFNNPVAAGLAKTPEQSAWTNFAAVKSGEDKFARELLDEVAGAEYVVEFTEAYSKIKQDSELEKRREVIPSRPLFDSEAKSAMLTIINKRYLKNFKKVKVKKQVRVVKKLLEIGASYNQIKRLTSLTRPMIDRLCL